MEAGIDSRVKQNRWVNPWLALLATAALFLVANRGAYRGYFDNDELDNLAFTDQLFPSDFAEGLLLPVFFRNNFRPAGHLFFRFLGDGFGLWFAPYVAAIQLLHLLNVGLLWALLRRLKLPPVACAAGSLLFAFHMAVFDIYWKPMYVFDLLCGTFCLICLLLWTSDRWIAWALSLLSLWLAFRSKEIAVMMPAVLVAYELLFGQKRWVRLAPFLAFSLWFGTRGLFHAAGLRTDYSLSFRVADLWNTTLFYAAKVTGVPFAGAIVLVVLMILAVVFVRDRRLYLGLGMFAVMLLPMLLLPGRMFSAYLYVPLIGLSIAAACVAARQRAVLIVLFFAAWLPWNYVNLRRMRTVTLEQAEDRREYVAALTDLADRQPAITSFIYLEGPLLEYGANAAARWLHPGKPILMVSEREPKLPGLLQSPKLAILYWDQTTHRLDPIVRAPTIGSYVRAGPDMPVWQLRDGWFPGEGSHRWTRPHATAEMMRPAGAKAIEITVIVNDEYLNKVHQSSVTLALDGVSCGAIDLTKTGLQTFRLPIPPAAAGPTELSIDVAPPYPASEPLGVAVVAFGFT